MTAGLTLDWSSGSIEGAVNRIKKIKRQLYGRAESQSRGDALVGEGSEPPGGIGVGLRVGQEGAQHLDEEQARWVSGVAGRGITPRQPNLT
ncbi:hypothetical protein OHB39_33940 [Streptomyces sp. NBC_00047]|uniref:hypothetical protein n=1 Tax=Streptomyces sp. NBC_00047 TaxID=2975627 RepID=UPI00225BEA6A|nr:hypothetical protein [Streptomyces sp. NBC_00047]MCX5612527.1 hypothetical protein [Streptomyces sp. NBC_00047]